MDKSTLLKHIAETAYNVGFGAKKHLATYDLVSKTPGLISFISFAFGVFALINTTLENKYFSAIFIVLGVLAMYTSFYDSKKESYDDTGRKLTKLFNDLKVLYGNVKNEDSSFTSHVAILQDIENQYNNISISHQIMFSNWYAHYKFFWEQQIGWIDEQLKFKLFRDKIPLSFTLLLIFIVVTAAALLRECN